MRLSVCVRAPLSALVFVLGLVATSPARADDFVSLTETQLDYNTKAVEALTAGDANTAIMLMRSAITPGEVNVLYLNLGRALAQTGQCAEALVAYDQALAAPAIESPTPAEVAKVVERYKSDLATCPGQLRLSCSPAEMQVSIDGAAPTPCPSAPVVVPPGEHSVVGSVGEAQTSHSVTLAAGQATELALSLDVAPQLPSDGDGMSWMGTTGIIVGGVGVAALVTAVILDVAVLGPDFDELEKAGAAGDVDAYNERRDSIDGLQPINQALLIGGGVLALGGATLLVLELTSDDSETQAAQTRPWLTADGAGFVWRMSW